MITNHDEKKKSGWLQISPHINTGAGTTELHYPFSTMNVGRAGLGSGLIEITVLLFQAPVIFQNVYKMHG